MAAQAEGDGGVVWLPCQQRLLHKYRASIIDVTEDKTTGTARITDASRMRQEVGCIDARWTSLLVKTEAVRLNTLVVLFPREFAPSVHAEALRNCATLARTGRAGRLILSGMQVHMDVLAPLGDESTAEPPKSMPIEVLGGTLGRGAWNVLRALRPTALRLVSEIDIPLRVQSLNEFQQLPFVSLGALERCTTLVVEGGPQRLDASSTWSFIRAAPACTLLKLRDCDVDRDAEADDGDYKSVPRTVTRLELHNVDPPWYTLALERPEAVEELVVATASDMHDDSWDASVVARRLARLTGLRKLTLVPYEANGARAVSLATLVEARNVCPLLWYIECQFRVRTDRVTASYHRAGAFSVILVAGKQFHLTTAISELRADSMLVYVHHSDTRIEADAGALAAWKQSLPPGKTRALQFFFAGAGARVALGAGVVPDDCVERAGHDGGMKPTSYCGACGCFIATPAMHTVLYPLGCPGGHAACTACARELVEHARQDRPHALFVTSFHVRCAFCNVDCVLACGSAHGATGTGAPDGFMRLQRVPGYRRPVLVRLRDPGAPVDVLSVDRVLGAFVYGLATRILPLRAMAEPIEILPGARSPVVALLHHGNEWAVLSVAPPLGGGGGSAVVRYIEPHNGHTAPHFADLVAHRTAHLFPDQPPTWKRVPIVYTRMPRARSADPAVELGAALVVALYECQTRAVPFDVVRHPLDTHVTLDSKLATVFAALESPDPPRDLGAWLYGFLDHDADRVSTAKRLVVSAKGDVWSTLPPEYARVPPNVTLDPVTQYTPQTLYRSAFLATPAARTEREALAAAVYFAAAFVATVPYTSRARADDNKSIESSDAMRTLVASVRMHASATDEKTAALGSTRFPLTARALMSATANLPASLEALLPALFASDGPLGDAVEAVRDTRAVRVTCRDQRVVHTTDTARTGDDARTACHAIDLVPGAPVTDPSHALEVTVAPSANIKLHDSDRVSVYYRPHPGQRARVYHVRRYETSGAPILLSRAPVRVDQVDGHRVLAAALVIDADGLRVHALHADGMYHAYANGEPCGAPASFASIRDALQTRGVAFAYATARRTDEPLLYKDAA